MKKIADLHIDTSEHMDQLYEVSYRRPNECSEIIYVADEFPGLP